MDVAHMRIDDRLIHGQIVTAWIADTKANCIIVSDDIASKDSTQKMLLKLSVPAGIELLIKSIEETAELLKTDDSKKRVLLIVRNPKYALKLFKCGFRVNKLNVGNISNTKSETKRKCLLPYIYVDEDDIKCLNEISDLGIMLDVRAVPNDKSIDFLSLI